jgi:hypothetical protein
MPRHRGGSALGAAAHGSGACCASPLRHLRAGTVARRGDACCASPCDTLASAQGFLSSNHRGSPAAARRRLKVSSQNGAWSRRLWLGKDVCRLLPRLAQASLGAAADRRRPPPQGAGALCQHQGGAGERPPFSTLRARPNEHPSFRCARVTSWLQLTMSGHRAGFRRQLVTAGPLPFKAKEVVLMLSEHETALVLRRALQAPEVMLDDAV